MQRPTKHSIFTIIAYSMFKGQNGHVSASIQVVSDFFCVIMGSIQDAHLDIPPPAAGRAHD